MLTRLDRYLLREVSVTSAAVTGFSTTLIRSQRWLGLF